MSSDFNWKHPDYIPIFQERAKRLARLRLQPELVPPLRAYYATHPADFINDWGVTFDTRNVEIGLPATVPFVLFPKQREWIDWVVAHWKSRTPGLSDKSRDMGLSWLAVATSATLCLHYEGLSIGFGSNLVRNVDKLDDPKSLFYKARLFMRYLPPEFKPDWNDKTDCPELRLIFRNTGSTMIGEGGDEIGRGGRAGIYFVDEAAFLERPQSVDASLSQTTNCRIDISTPNGLGNAFAEKRFAARPADEDPPYVKTFHWRDDPRKGEEWYARQLARPDLTPVIIAQEIDLNYSASVEGVLIPSAWVQAAVDAHLKLGIEPTGEASGALDVADEGRDKNAWASGRGVLLSRLEEWSGIGSDIFGTVQRAFACADEEACTSFQYDADGLGAGVRGDSRIINEGREAVARKEAVPFRGSGAVLWPEAQDVENRKNKDYYANRKAQAWFSVRKLFQTTFRALDAKTKGEPFEYDPDSIISLDSRLPLLGRLCQELSQPTYKINTTGKMLIDKAPDGTRSPNLADAVMIRFARAERAPMVISDDALRQSAPTRTSRFGGR